MLTRRDFMQTAAAAGVVATATPALAAYAEIALPRMQVRTAIFDTRNTMTAGFGASAGAQGATAHGVAGDVTSLWRTTLAPAWKARPEAIMGMSEHGPLFILERMGWKHDMRATFRGQHSADAAGMIRHDLQGPAELVDELAARLPQAGADFGAVIAEVLQGLPLGGGEKKHLVLNVAAKADLAEPLYSYVLAPRCDCEGLKPYSHNHSA